MKEPSNDNISILLRKAKKTSLTCNSWFLLYLSLVSCCLIYYASTVFPRKQEPRHFRRRLTSEKTASSAVHLLTPSSFTVVGPSVFPKPSAYGQDNDDVQPYLKPSFGAHRQEADAVFVFAAEYGLNTYICFVESLRKTGFTGDIVFAVSTLDLKDVYTREYLSEPNNGIVTYELTLKCFNAEMEEVNSAKGGMRVCNLDELWAGTDQKPLMDPRPARTIATTRYELYWIWSLNYDPHSWIMLLDARDAYFQSNPFVNVPREKEKSRTDGVLHFFGENADATRIGKSPKNRKWLETAYGDVVVAALEDKPTICSGSTMGEQVALETYLRAMVAESDETGTKLMGADQGFHNYLYYTRKLASATTIRSIHAFDQGRGAINNLGALRTAPLEEWGNGRLVRNNSEADITVLNWDGTPSPVVHQFDRHKLLSTFIYKLKTSELRTEYYEKHPRQ